MPTATATKQRRAIGIIRVSQTKGREGESFASPDDQRDRIAADSERRGLRLIDVIEELDVSGGTPLDERSGLRGAVEAIEAGEAEVLVVAYFDRLVRSLPVQAEVVARVEAVGGQVLTVDAGEVSTKSAASWASGTMLGMMAEFQRRSAAERSAEAQARAVSRGVVPWPTIPPGYLRGEDGVLQPDPATRPAVEGAFRLRAGGATIAEVREYLREQGIERSPHGTQALLASRLLLGEIHFGDLVNLEAHEPIIDRDLWAAVQRVRVPRGRRAKSDRLLARLGVLRCETCGGRMVVGTQTQNGRSYPFYRCSHVREDCERRVTIGAEIVEQVVAESVCAALADIKGRATVEATAQAADQALADAQCDLDAAIRTLAGFQDEAAARDRLAELRRVRDEARAHREQLGDPRPAVTVTAATDWDRLTLDERRDLIRATVDRVTVGPGRGPGRITVELFAE